MCYEIFWKPLKALNSSYEHFVSKNISFAEGGRRGQGATVNVSFETWKAVTNQYQQQSGSESISTNQHQSVKIWLCHCQSTRKSTFDLCIMNICILLLKSPCSSAHPFVTEKYRVIDSCTIHTCLLQNQGPVS